MDLERSSEIIVRRNSQLFHFVNNQITLILVRPPFFSRDGTHKSSLRSSLTAGPLPSSENQAHLADGRIPKMELLPTAKCVCGSLGWKLIQLSAVQRPSEGADVARRPHLFLAANILNASRMVHGVHVLHTHEGR